MHVRMNPQKTTVAIRVVVNRALFASLVFTVGVASAQAPTLHSFLRASASAFTAYIVGLPKPIRIGDILPEENCPRKIVLHYLSPSAKVALALSSVRILPLEPPDPAFRGVTVNEGLVHTNERKFYEHTDST